MSDPVFAVDIDGRTLETNVAFEQAFGSAQDPNSIFERWPELEPAWSSVLKSITDGRALQIDVPASDASGRAVIYEVRLFKFVRSEPGQVGEPDGVAGICRDATRDRERTQQLELQATTDDLTGLFSHNQLGVLLDLEIRSAVRRKSVGCFLYLDIDGFKQLNDRLGHAEGDRLLRKFASLLENNLRAADVVARLGGDEFGVILVDAVLENGVKKAQQLDLPPIALPLIISDLRPAEALA
jgi:GGDEF domain-containing protein